VIIMHGTYYPVLCLMALVMFVKTRNAKTKKKIRGAACSTSFFCRERVNQD